MDKSKNKSGQGWGSSSWEVNHEADPGARNNRRGNSPWNVDTGYMIGRHAKEFPQNGGMKRLLLFLQRLIGKAEKPLLHTSEKDVTPIAFDISYLSCRLELIGLVSKKFLFVELELCFLNQLFDHINLD